LAELCDEFTDLLSSLLDDPETLDTAARAILTAVLHAAERVGELRPERADEFQTLEATLRQGLEQS